MSAMTAAAALVARDLRLALARRGDAIAPLMFALIVVALFPLALGPDARMLARIAGSIAWVTALLASLLSLDALFRADRDDGSLDLLITSNQPLALLCAAKLLAYWLLTGLPLTLAMPLLALMLGASSDAAITVGIALALGTPTLALTGGTCAALAVALPRSGILLALMALPLWVPVLIFGAGAVESATSGLSPAPALLFLAAALAVTLPLGPLACAFALRIGAE